MFTVRTARDPGSAVPQVSMGFEVDLETGLPIVSQQNLGTENLQSTVIKEGLHTSTTMPQTATALPQQGFVPLLADIATSHQNIHFQTRHNDPVTQGAANVPFIEKGTVDAEPVVSICPNEAGSLASYNNLSFIKNADGNYVIIHHPPQLSLISETSGELQDAVANISERVDATGDATTQSIIISNQDILQTFQTTDADGNVVISELQGFNLDGTSYTMTEKDLQKPLAGGAPSSKLEKFSREQLVSLGSSNEEIIGNLFLNSRLRVGRPKKIIPGNVDKPHSQIKSSDPAGIDTSLTLDALKTEHVVQKQPRCIKSESLNDVKDANCSPAKKVSNISVENQSSTAFPETSDIESNNSKSNGNNISFEINIDKDENVDYGNQQGVTESEKSGCSNARPQRKRKYTAKVKEMQQTTDICNGKHRRQKQGQKVKLKQDEEVKINNDMFVGKSEDNLKEICPLRRSCRPVKPSKKPVAESVTRVSLWPQEPDTNSIHGNGATFCKTRTLCKRKTILPQDTDLEEVSEGRGLDISSIKQYYDGDSLVIKLPPICMNILKGKQLTVELDVDNDLSVSQIRRKSVSEGHSQYSFNIARSVNTTPECDTKSSCHYVETNKEKELHSETGHKIHIIQENVNCDISGATQCPNDVNSDDLLPCSTGINNKTFKNSLHEPSTVTGSLADTVAVIEKVDANDDNEANLTVESFMSSFNKELQQIPGMYPDSEGADYGAADTVCPVTPSTDTNFKAGAEVEGQLNKNERRNIDADDDTTQGLDNKSRGKTGRGTRKKPADKRKEDKDVKTSEAKKYTVRIADNGNRVYCCSICLHESKSHQNMVVHMYQHTDERPYQCEVCGQTFKGPSNLSAHRRQHSSTFNYDCPMCTRKFRDRGTFKQHMQRHMGVKKHICEHCGKSFVISSDLKKHIRVHTGEKPYECDQCGRRFGDCSGMLRHRHLHNNTFRYQCSLCWKVFRRRDLCTNHVRRVHFSDSKTVGASSVLTISEKAETVPVESSSFPAYLKKEVCLASPDVTRIGETAICPDYIQLKKETEPSDGINVIPDNTTIQPKNRFEALTEEACRRLCQQPAAKTAGDFDHGYAGNRNQIHTELTPQHDGKEAFSQTEQSIENE